LKVNRNENSELSGACRTHRVQLNHQRSSPAHCAASSVFGVRFHRFMQVKCMTENIEGWKVSS